MLGSTLILQRRPGKNYVHGADLFDALTGLYPGWRRARLCLQGKLMCGGLILAAADVRPGSQPAARMELESAGGQTLEIQVLPLPQYPSPASTQEIPEDNLLAGSHISDLSCSFQRRDPAKPLGLTAVTGAINVLRQLEPTSQWLLAELDLPNPNGWPPSYSFTVHLRKQRLTGRFASFTLKQGERSTGSLHFARHETEAQP
jgi:hypothetical protein